MTAKDYVRPSCAKEPMTSLMECVLMCHSILERHLYLIVDSYYQLEPKAFSQIKQKVIILQAYCFVLLDDGLQSVSVLVELNDI